MKDEVPIKPVTSLHILYDGGFALEQLEVRDCCSPAASHCSLFEKHFKKSGHVERIFQHQSHSLEIRT